MLEKFSEWMDERFDWRKVWEAIFLRKVPHVNWLYTLGSATLFVATIQAVTGILLTLYYVPTPDHAYDSVIYITTQLPAGWLIRGLHHWGASAMIVLVVSASACACFSMAHTNIHGRPPGSPACCSC